MKAFLARTETVFDDGLQTDHDLVQPVPAEVHQPPHEEVIVVLKISGFHPTTNEEVSFRDITILTLENEKIISQRGLSDLFSLYLKLGLIQMPQS